MNLAQRMGELMLAAGFYGPAEGGAAVLPLLQAKRPQPTRIVVSSDREMGLSARIFAALPIGVDNAVRVRVVAERMNDGTSSTKVGSNMPSVRGALHVGKRGQYLYYREA